MVKLGDRDREEIREGGQESFQNELYAYVKLPMNIFN